MVLQYAIKYKMLSNSDNDYRGATTILHSRIGSTRYFPRTSIDNMWF